jgi:hypothetical protein
VFVKLRVGSDGTARLQGVLQAPAGIPHGERHSGKWCR